LLRSAISPLFTGPSLLCRTLASLSPISLFVSYLGCVLVFLLLFYLSLFFSSSLFLSSLFSLSILISLSLPFLSSKKTEAEEKKKRRKKRLIQVFLKFLLFFLPYVAFILRPFFYLGDPLVPL